MYIRVQKLAYNDKGVVVSGSASICKTIYTTGLKSGHSRREVVELLGKVVWIDKDRKEGIFFSPTRGLVSYNLEQDAFSFVENGDPRLEGSNFSNREVCHSNFGDAYLFLSILGEGVLLRVLRTTFEESPEYQRAIAHLLHGILKNGSKIKCGEFLERSMASFILTDISRSTLDCDSAFFSEMGKDYVKVSFFRNFIAEMRKIHPTFGRACYVDSTPLPNETEDNPYNALCSHGTDGAVIQTRLALVLDIETNLPVWYHIFPGNVLDNNTIRGIADDVKATLDIDIIDSILDAGYACTELFKRYHIPTSEELANGIQPEGETLVRMPAKLGYPHDQLYLDCKALFHDADHIFDYKGHTYFGKRFIREFLGFTEYCYVYVDHDQATDLGRQWRLTHPEEWDALSKNDKEWYLVKDGFFILTGNKDGTARDVLIEYRDRVKIELIFKTMKDFTDALPLGKWDAQRVLGKILLDIIELIAIRFFNEAISVVGFDTPRIITQLQSLDCFKKSDDILEVNTPKYDVRKIFEKVEYTIPSRIEIAAFKKEVLEGIPMDRTPVTVVKKRPGRKPKVKNASPEEKERKRCLDRAMKEAEKVFKKATEDADKAYRRVEKKAKFEMEKMLGRAASKRDKALINCQSDDARKQADDAYKLAELEAKEKYDSQITGALKTREARKEVAKAEYDAKIAECKEKYTSV